MQHMEFIKSAANRQRYWARSFVGWQYFSRARPNPAHEALASLEAAGWLRGGLITQNVDGLHVAAGSHSCLHLHGRIDTVECQMCGDLSPRAELQDRLAEANAAWARARSLDDPAASTPTELRADGDLELTDADVNGFAVPSCVRCGDGMLKPHVTFFGGSVPRESVEGAAVAVARADALLVVGSSLQTFSAFRLARAAAQEGKPIALLNVGPTRADELVPERLRVPCDAVEVLPRLAEMLGSRPHAPIPEELHAPSNGIVGFA
jgi:NAD-dependent deacetylase sirtuin 4